MIPARERAVQVILAAVLVTPSLLLGAVHEELLALYGVAAAAILALLFTGPGASRIRIDLPAAVFAALAVFTLLQLVPWPSAVVKVVSPAAYEVRARALGPLGGALPAFMPFTLDATLTVPEVVKLLLYLAVYLASREWVARRGSAYPLGLIAATGAANAAIFLAHRILMLDKVYGIYQPRHLALTAARASAPLVNENHLAALLGLGAAVAIGLALKARERSRRLLLVSLSALVGAALVITLSRGGIAAFVAGQCLFVLLRLLARQPARRPAVHLAWLPLGLALSLGLALFTAQDAILGEFAGGDVKKLGLAVEQLPLIGRFWAVGVGRGAFWVGFPLVSDRASRITFTHAENAAIQLLADWGVPVGGAALALFVVLAGRFLRRPPRRVERAAAVAAIAAFGLHNLVDFNMEIPGVAVLAAALLGVLEGGRADFQDRPRRPFPRPALAALALLALAVAAVTGLWAAPHQIDREERAMRVALGDRGSKRFEREALAELLARHPADWYLPFAAGVRIYAQRSGNPLPWLSRAIELNRSAAPAHLYAGRTLLRANRIDQAMLELRLAIRFNPGFAGSVAGYLVARAPEFERLRRVAESRPEQIALWGALAERFARSGLEAEAEKADLALLGIDPKNPWSLARHGRRLLSRGAYPQALALAGRLGAVPGLGPAGALLEAEIWDRQALYGRSAAVLEKSLVRFPGNRDIVRALAWARQRAEDHAGALQAAALLKRLSTDTRGRAEGAMLEADLSAAEGRQQVALARYAEAEAIDPANPGPLFSIARISEQIGDWPRALEALRKLAAVDPQNPEVRRRVEEIENRIRSSRLLGR